MNTQLQRLLRAGLLSLIAGILPAALHATDTCPRIHWLGPGGQPSTFEPGQLPAHFNPGRESVIFIHGGQVPPFDSRRFEVMPRPRPDVGDSRFNCGRSAIEAGKCFSYSDLIQRGFNVGVFYWKSVMKKKGYFFPRLDAPATEDRVWNDGVVPCAGSGSSVNVVQRFREEYQRAANVATWGPWYWRTPGFHLVAHSMGAQVALRFLDQAAEAGEELPQALILLDPAWVTTVNARRTADLVDKLSADESISTAIVMGKSTDQYWWDTASQRSAFRAAYRRISESVLDFWLEADLDGSYPTNHGWKTNFEKRHRRIVRYWFKDLAPKLDFSGSLHTLYGYPTYPYALVPQCGPAEVHWTCEWTPSGLRCYRDTHYPWLERIEEAKGEKALFFEVAMGARNRIDPEGSCYVACGFTSADTVATGNGQCS